MSADQDELRIDKWLWAVRLFKTRSLAMQACQGGRVKVDGRNVKPAASVRPGNVVEVSHPGFTKTVRVKDLTDRRVGAKLVEVFLEDLTPDEEYQRQCEFQSRSPALRARGTGRPTKKDRRETDRFFGL